MLSVLTFASGRMLKYPINENIFMPAYTASKMSHTAPSLEKQQKDFAAFAAKLKAVKRITTDEPGKINAPA